MDNGPKLRFICDCGSDITTHIGNVVRGNTRSCGCLKIGTSKSSPAGEIYSFVKNLREDTFWNFWYMPENGSRKREYDIYVLSEKLAIEYHGLYWHSEATRTNRDYDKYLASQARGDRLIQIYQDEWEQKQGIFKTQIQEILAPIRKIRIKPVFEHYFKTSPEARDFLNQNHYLGAASGCLTVLAKYKEAIVGVWVFMKREEGTILWHRACWDHKYKAWNPHQKALETALPLLRGMGFRRIVSFSDNRIHTGTMKLKLLELKAGIGFGIQERNASRY